MSAPPSLPFFDESLHASAVMAAGLDLFITELTKGGFEALPSDVGCRLRHPDVQHMTTEIFVMHDISRVIVTEQLFPRFGAELPCDKLATLIASTEPEDGWEISVDSLLSDVRLSRVIDLHEIYPMRSFTIEGRYVVTRAPYAAEQVRHLFVERHRDALGSTLAEMILAEDAHIFIHASS